MDATVPFRLVRFRASDVAAATGGQLLGPDTDVDGATFDSREVRPGQLFVALVAARDGHEFVVDAARAGASAALCSADVVGTEEFGLTVIRVPDTAVALGRFATAARRRLDVPVVGITGSVGKTSTKDLVAAAVGATRRVHANVRSFNNEQGLPVTVLGAPDDVEVLVTEMGMRGFGQIRALCEIAAPTVGVVTCVGEAHTELVGGIDGVARAKRELVEALPPSGTAVLNADDPRVLAMAPHTAAVVVTYGRSDHADVRLGPIRLDELARPRFDVHTPWGEAQVELAVSGAHMAVNAAAAIAVAGSLGVPLDAAVEALGTARLSSMRMEVHRLASGAVVLDDAYNANPTSMRAALEALAGVDARRRVAVLGEMGELEDPDDAHRRVAADVDRLGLELVAVGTGRYGVDPVDDPVEALGELGAGDAVLFKASRFVGLERHVRRLLGTD